MGKDIQSSKVLKSEDGSIYIAKDGTTTWYSSSRFKYHDKFPELKVGTKQQVLRARCCEHHQDGAYVFWDLRIFQDPR
eukprot:25749-Lingulodinium_polyedra.AAC.1